jgi:hypothetical protein
MDPGQPHRRTTSDARRQQRAAKRGSTLIFVRTAPAADVQQHRWTFSPTTQAASHLQVDGPSSTTFLKCFRDRSVRQHGLLHRGRRPTDRRRKAAFFI